MTIEQVYDAALALPDAERLELTETLLASLQEEDRSPLHQGWLQIIERRTAELRSGQVKGVPWEEVRRQAREKLGD